MGIPPESIDASLRILRDLGATRVVLFGTGLRDPARARDLDLGCRGLSPTGFLNAVGELLDRVAVPVDLVDLSDDTPFTRMVEERGRVLYER